MDIVQYNLMIQATIPASSGIRGPMLVSPRVLLASYEGHCTEDDAPEWTRMVPGRDVEFRQPRGAMAEVYAMLALWNVLEVRLSLCFLVIFTYIPIA